MRLVVAIWETAVEILDTSSSPLSRFRDRGIEDIMVYCKD